MTNAIKFATKLSFVFHTSFSSCNKYVVKQIVYKFNKKSPPHLLQIKK